MLQQQDLTVTALGPCRHESPLVFDSPSHERDAHFVSDSMRIRYNVEIGGPTEPAECDLSFEEAGPREKLFFDPKQTTAAIATCGGLSPGLNNVIRSVFYELADNYKVRRVLGIRNGYLGLNPQSGREPIELNRQFVEPIDKLGGTALGSSRGPQDPSLVIDFLQSQGVDILFCIGGDGTQRGAEKIFLDVQRRGLPISVVGIPKTIDNDIPFVHQSFGYATALEKAAEVIRSAHVEARDAVNGVGLVKLMGRYAGFIAAGASVISQEVNFTLVPEISFPLDGENGFLAALERRMHNRGHAVVAVAEGAGQHLFKQPELNEDAAESGRMGDVGVALRDKIVEHFASRGFPISMKYLDPSYHIRSVPANAFDRFLCDQMGRHAVHAAMAGKSGMLIGHEHNQFINVPIPTAIARTKQLDVTGDLWRAVLQVTRQPRW
ncbi:MAG: ATP-dependent 6-phosphofructokinase [Pirellulales bacterium]